jgi:hypothetical protein
MARKNLLVRNVQFVERLATELHRSKPQKCISYEAMTDFSIVGAPGTGNGIGATCCLLIRLEGLWI